MKEETATARLPVTSPRSFAACRTDKEHGYLGWIAESDGWLLKQPRGDEVRVQKDKEDSSESLTCGPRSLRRITTKEHHSLQDQPETS